MSLISLHRAVIMGRVSTEPGEKNASSLNWLPTTNQNNVVCDQGQLIHYTFTGSRRKKGKNIFSIDKCLDRVSLFLFQNECTVNVQMDSNLYISALQRQPCLLKTNSTRVLVTRLITLLLIICPSSYKARLDNLIGQTISVRRSIPPNGATPDRTSRLQMLWAGLSSVWYPG